MTEDDEDDPVQGPPTAAHTRTPSGNPVPSPVFGPVMASVLDPVFRHLLPRGAGARSSGRGRAQLGVTWQNGPLIERDTEEEHRLRAQVVAGDEINPDNATEVGDEEVDDMADPDVGRDIPENGMRAPNFNRSKLVCFVTFVPRAFTVRKSEHCPEFRTLG